MFPGDYRVFLVCDRTPDTNSDNPNSGTGARDDTHTEKDSNRTNVCSVCLSSSPLWVSPSSPLCNSVILHSVWPLIATYLPFSLFRIFSSWKVDFKKHVSTLGCREVDFIVKTDKSLSLESSLKSEVRLPREKETAGFPWTWPESLLKRFFLSPSYSKRPSSSVLFFAFFFGIA